MLLADEAGEPSRRLSPCPECGGVVETFGVWRNLGYVGRGEWRQVRVELVECPQCQRVLPERFAPAPLPRGFWTRWRRRLGLDAPSPHSAA